jgi:hypothetical protein
MKTTLEYPEFGSLSVSAGEKKKCSRVCSEFTAISLQVGVTR